MIFYIVLSDLNIFHVAVLSKRAALMMARAGVKSAERQAAVLASEWAEVCMAEKVSSNMFAVLVAFIAFGTLVTTIRKLNWLHDILEF